ncbi:DNA replication and repair protein RecN [Seinonella peptonophila]|uniref:DNA repair protein RecN n=1 Tax=Seinonella peptonophila TaxID=112248 RepID=A0A1M4TLT1_9BACL|nr:DNA repair protein RecN [Seinonella peptonophila]SHE45365.1 DNA replication and repair protein RecN [Seinonella peptonophila]
MLTELAIQQFAIIEKLHIEFSTGFHVLTGETGAGKSILIDALALVMGGRASTDYIRHGASKAIIEAVFELPTHHVVWSRMKEWGWEEEEDLLIIRREITVQGKSICRVNGKTVTVTMLREIGSRLLDICGQHEHQSLLHMDEQLELVDQFAGQSILEIREQYQECFHQYRQVCQELEQLMFDNEELARRLDLYQYQIQEIDQAQLMDQDWEQLEREQSRLAHMEKLMSSASLAYERLMGEGQGLDQLRQALVQLDEMATVDDSVGSLYDMISSSFYQLEEVARMVGDYREQLEFDPERYHHIEERLHYLHQLRRKYGQEIEEIIDYRNKIAADLEKLEHRDDRVEELKRKQVECEEALADFAGRLTALRKKAASELESRIENELTALQMSSTVFHIAFLPQTMRKDRFKESGQDEVVFQISPNPGEPLRSLAKIASGGELSRIMLALKSVFSNRGNLEILVFDEIDTGVSGRAAQAIAERMARLAHDYQIFAVTHLPQVACMADHHYRIFKETDGTLTRTFVQPVIRVERIRELARMLGGAEVTSTTMKHAEEMLALANRVKDRYTS